MYGARTAEIRRNRDRLAGSSVSIVGFYDGILTVHLLRVFTRRHNTGTALRGPVREKERAERERNERAEIGARGTPGGREKEEREKGEAYKIGLKGCGLVRVDYS